MLSALSGGHAKGAPGGTVAFERRVHSETGHKSQESSADCARMRDTAGLRRRDAETRRIRRALPVAGRFFAGAELLGASGGRSVRRDRTAGGKRERFFRRPELIGGKRGEILSPEASLRGKVRTLFFKRRQKSEGKKARPTRAHEWRADLSTLAQKLFDPSANRLFMRRGLPSSASPPRLCVSAAQSRRVSPRFSPHASVLLKSREKGLTL